MSLKNKIVLSTYFCGNTDLSTTLVLALHSLLRNNGCKMNLSIDNGKVTYKYEKKFVVNHLVAHFDCDNGYFLSGLDRRYCGGDILGTYKFWDEEKSPTCKGMEK